MALTSKDIENQSFSIDRKGYDVNEVDDFLERVSNEVDGMNARIAELQRRLNEATSRADEAQRKAKGLADALAAAQEGAGETVAFVAPATSFPESADEKDRMIASLQKQLEERKADANAIAQALIIAQRSGDEIIANAKKAALSTQQDAENEAKRILDKANGEKQRVMHSIAELQSDREEARSGYQDMLRSIINDASTRLSAIGGGSVFATPAGDPSITSPQPPAAPEPARAAAMNPLESFTATYTTPRSSSHGVTPAAPKASSAHKDLSGFGEADDTFSFDDMD